MSKPTITLYGDDKIEIVFPNNDRYTILALNNNKM